MKVINGKRREFERSIIKLLMCDPRNTEVDKLIEKLKPAGKLKPVTCDQKPSRPQV